MHLGNQATKFYNKIFKTVRCVDFLDYVCLGEKINYVIFNRKKVVTSLKKSAALLFH